MNEIARRHGSSVQIRMWVLSQHAAGFGGVLHSSVTIVGLNDQLLCAQLSDATTKLGKVYADEARNPEVAQRHVEESGEVARAV